MTVSAAQAAAFYAEVIEHGSVFGVRDDDGVPAPLNADGQRAMPFWSLASRAQRVVETADAYAGFDVFELSLPEFMSRWLPGLERDGLRVGLNWSGSRATGYDVLPAEVAGRLEGASS